MSFAGSRPISTPDSPVLVSDVGCMSHSLVQFISNLTRGIVYIWPCHHTCQGQLWKVQNDNVCLGT